MGEEDLRRRPSIEAPASAEDCSVTEVPPVPAQSPVKASSVEESLGLTRLQMWGIVLAMVGATPMLYPHGGLRGAPNAWIVLFYGWLSAITTGLGALPCGWFRKYSGGKFVGLANAITAGMMLAASGSLIFEGYQFDEDKHLTDYSSLHRVIAGAAVGVLFVYVVAHYLEQFEDLTIFDLPGASARQVVLFVMVMTLHSLAEGVSIGVSFGGTQGTQLGQFISLSLAVHNIPEGFAVALKMIEKGEQRRQNESMKPTSPTFVVKGVSTIALVLVAICTSLPQPIMAVPAYLFVETFMFWLPVGLGFAGGAMCWVAITELLREAMEEVGNVTALFTATAAGGVMLWVQHTIR